MEKPDPLRYIVAILKKGPKKREAIIAEVKKLGFHGSYKTIDRRLKALREAELLKGSDDGTYEWIKEYQEFNSGEYEKKLEHSKELMGILTKNGNFIDTESIRSSDYFDNFRQHLETGYQDVFTLYREWEKLEEEKKRRNEAFNEEIKRIAWEKGFEIKKNRDLVIGEKQVTTVIFDSIKRRCELAAEKRLIEPIEITSAPFWLEDPIAGHIAINVHLKEELEALIESCVQDETVKCLYNELADVEKRESDVYSKLNKEIGTIFKNVKLRLPLKGSCSACQYTIGRRT